ncbi:hypothetical protein E2C01_096609 [Portunus trituberculatus]|uniref:Uncharacterized protein n=1 Tax=Portunus trituberculatus TaxID=210409 RepID=A0A5B7K3I4_PORTR|nr:hypothetical protein [Portunus trituberculatus]
MRENLNYSIRLRNSLGHVAPLGLTGERYISHQTTRFGNDSHPGRLYRLEVRIRDALTSYLSENDNKQRIN